MRWTFRADWWVCSCCRAVSLQFDLSKTQTRKLLALRLCAEPRCRVMQWLCVCVCARPFWNFAMPDMPPMQTMPLTCLTGWGIMATMAILWTNVVAPSVIGLLMPTRPKMVTGSRAGFASGSHSMRLMHKVLQVALPLGWWRLRLQANWPSTTWTAVLA